MDVLVLLSDVTRLLDAAQAEGLALAKTVPPEREHEKDGVAVINHIAVKAMEEKR